MQQWLCLFGGSNPIVEFYWEKNTPNNIWLVTPFALPLWSHYVWMILQCHRIIESWSVLLGDSRVLFLTTKWMLAVAEIIEASLYNQVLPIIGHKRPVSSGKTASCSNRPYGEDHSWTVTNIPWTSVNIVSRSSAFLFHPWWLRVIPPSMVQQRAVPVVQTVSCLIISGSSYISRQVLPWNCLTEDNYHQSTGACQHMDFTMSHPCKEQRMMQKK